ncbi:MAG: hypothetical protein LCH96_05805 [Actinobacteria bacterium]|nr:hypothetical protein [Actinomycetota bacterium]
MAGSRHALGHIALLTKWIESDREIPLDDLVALLQSVLTTGPVALLAELGSLPAGLARD